MMARLRIPIFRGVLAVLLVGVGYIVSSRSALPADGSPGTYQPAPTNQAEHQFVLVYLFSANCAACNDPQIPELVEATKLAVQQHASTTGSGIHVLAASNDLSVAGGFEYLEKLGNFDEVSLGGGWRNIGMLRYVWQMHAGMPEVPQVVILSRHATGGQTTPVYGVDEESVIIRLVGKNEIRRWLMAGAPM